MKNLCIIGCMAVLLVSVWISGCEETRSFTSDANLVGAWLGRRAGVKPLLFYPDGTWSTGDSEGTWTIENRLLVVTNTRGVVFTYEYLFSDDGDILTLVDVDYERTSSYIRR